MDFFGDLDAHWVWLTIGVALAAAEMAVPGVFLIWLGGAAIITGLITMGTGIGLPIQIGIFSVMAILSVFMGRQYLRDNPILSSDPLMNRRVARLVGETALVTEAIEHGTGRVKVGDSEWSARGDDAAVGARVRISGGEGSILSVEPLGGKVLPPAEGEAAS